MNVEKIARKPSVIFLGIAIICLFLFTYALVPVLNALGVSVDPALAMGLFSIPGIVLILVIWFAWSKVGIKYAKG